MVFNVGFLTDFILILILGRGKGVIFSVFVFLSFFLVFFYLCLAFLSFFVFFFGVFLVFLVFCYPQFLSLSI